MNYLKDLNELIKTLTNASKRTVFIIILAAICFGVYIFRVPLIDRFGADQVERGIDKSTLVNEVLRQMMEEFSAGRAYVYRFHNGVNYYDGSHKIRTSMDFEVVANGISAIGLFMQDIPTSLFADQIKAIIDEQILATKREQIEDRAARSVMYEFGISHTAVLPFYDSRGKLVMMVGVDWINRDNAPFFEDRFRKYVDKVGRMLTDQRSDEIVNIFSDEVRLVRGTEQPYLIEKEKEVPQYCRNYVALKKEHLLSIISNTQ